MSEQKQAEQSNSVPIRERTQGEKDAYQAGFQAGAEATLRIFDGARQRVVDEMRAYLQLMEDSRI
jgi:hypothetical protein